MLETASHDPGSIGLTQRAPRSCVLVILGGGGDLAQRKLLPAMYNLALDGALPEHFAVLGVGRREYSDEDYRRFAREAIESHSRREADSACWSELEPSLFFLSGDFEDDSTFSRLRARLAEIEPERDIPDNHVFYLSIPPAQIETCVRQLDRAGLIRGPGDADGFSRVIVEKPIGHDLESARAINETLACVLDESQIFRIDHYLGKETVQNIFVMRFANAIFEPLWNEKHIDHVQITVAENQGIGGRGGYYDASGALRDMMQNHILQLLSLIAMEPPWGMNADVVRGHKLDVLSCLRPVERCEECVVRAQYVGGRVGEENVPGYRDEKGVDGESITETYVAIKTFVDNWRWAGVPFYLRTGKRLAKRSTEIAVQFKQVPPVLFNVGGRGSVDPNVLALRIQPDEGFSLRVSAKNPGATVRTHSVEMDFGYGERFGEEAPEAYERLLLDVMAGDATLFMRRDEVEAAWTWITNILESWEASGVDRIPQYEAGSWGPEEADRLIGADGRTWREP